jgi:hypothetical protein
MWNVDRDRIPMWVIYDSPSDFPGQTIARLWYSLPKPEATDILIVANLSTIRAAVGSHGYVSVGRLLLDDPCIMEVWL